MNSIYFISGNAGKVRELKAMIPYVEQLEIDLPEIQEIDSRKIIQAKVQEAFKHHKGPFVVEDASLAIDSLGGLPGPLAKWFEKTVGTEGIYQMTTAFEGDTARARCIIGYAKTSNDIQYFEGVVEGRIVPPRGDSGFGWDPIFQPIGHTKTFAEMGTEGKNAISHRHLAAEKLAKALT